MDEFIDAIIWLSPFILGYFGCGLLAFLSACIHDMRNEPYDERYFEDELGNAFITILCGCFSLIILIGIIISERFINLKKHRYFTRFMYWIANVGIKKDESDK